MAPEPYTPSSLSRDGCLDEIATLRERLALSQQSDRAMAMRAERAERERDEAEAWNQRCRDMVRHCRGLLFMNDLLDEVEYVALCNDRGAAGRLDDYTDVRRERDEARQAAAVEAKAGDRARSNLGQFVATCAAAHGLPATSAPEVVLRQARVTFDAAHRALSERDEARVEVERLRKQLWGARGEPVSAEDRARRDAEVARRLSEWVASDAAAGQMLATLQANCEHLEERNERLEGEVERLRAEAAEVQRGIAMEPVEGLNAMAKMQAAPDEVTMGDRIAAYRFGLFFAGLGQAVKDHPDGGNFITLSLEPPGLDEVVAVTVQVGEAKTPADRIGELESEVERLRALTLQPMGAALPDGWTAAEWSPSEVTDGHLDVGVDGEHLAVEWDETSDDYRGKVTRRAVVPLAVVRALLARIPVEALEVSDGE